MTYTRHITVTVLAFALFFVLAGSTTGLRGQASNIGDEVNDNWIREILCEKLGMCSRDGSEDGEKEPPEQEQETADECGARAFCVDGSSCPQKPENCDVAAPVIGSSCNGDAGVCFACTKEQNGIFNLPPRPMRPAAPGQPGDLGSTPPSPPQTPPATPPSPVLPPPAAPPGPPSAIPQSMPPAASCPEGSVPFAQLTLGQSVCDKYAVEVSPRSGCYRAGAVCQSCMYCKATTGTTPFNCDKEEFCGMSGNFCKDSDGGVNKEVRGFVNPGTGHYGEKIDYCVSDFTLIFNNGKWTSETGIIAEMHCPLIDPGAGNPGYYEFINHLAMTRKDRCTHKNSRCIEGACVTDWEMPVKSCSDSDGSNIRSPGTVSIEGVSAFKDSCIWDSVEEWDCKDGNTLVHKLVKCPDDTLCRIGEGSCSTGTPPPSGRSAGTCGDRICAFEEQESCPDDCPKSSYCGDGICALWETCQPDCPASLFQPPAPRPGY